jgi:hypothetical protein
MVAVKEGKEDKKPKLIEQKKTVSKGFSKKSYISITKAKEATTVLKEFLRRDQGKTSDKKSSDERKTVMKLEHVDDGFDNTMAHQCVVLQVVLKKIPSNSQTFVHTIGPLPFPFRYETPSIDICLIVRDPDPKNPLGDRDLDLESTKNVYLEKLREAGFSEDFLSHRLVILPMRQLLTEFIEFEAKGNLVCAYDVFLADKSLMKNRESGLNKFLGNKFWIQRKKAPVPVNLALQGPELKQEIIGALDSTQLHVTGKGVSISCKIASLTQSPQSIAYNLQTVLQFLKKVYSENVESLSLAVDSGSSFSLPIFLDLSPSPGPAVTFRKNKRLQRKLFKIPKLYLKRSRQFAKTTEDNDV